MRNPNRIGPFCDRLKAVWSQVSDWRFGQLMMNIFGDMYSNGIDPFFQEDEQMIEYMERYFKKD